MKSIFNLTKKGVKKIIDSCIIEQMQIKTDPKKEDDFVTFWIESLSTNVWYKVWMNETGGCMYNEAERLHKFDNDYNYFKTMKGMGVIEI